MPQTEALARIRINNILSALGWRLDDENGREANVRLERNLKNPADLKKLGKHRPDYVLYAENSDVPVGIIEAKKPNDKKMSEALEQGMRYARKLGYSQMVVFASDGNVTMARHASGAPLTINKEQVDDFLPQSQLVMLAKNPSVDLGREIESISMLISLFEDVSNDLRRDGVEAGMDALKEFCLVLFVKIMSEKNKALPGCEWQQLEMERGDEMLACYKRVVGAYKEKFGDIFAEMKIKNPQTLEKIVHSIGGLNFNRSSLDVKGGAYEYFLSKYSTGRKSVLGQYFTPRHITRMMAQLLNLDLNETVYDPFCGTGGMLVACYDLMRNQIESGDADGIVKLNNNTLYGRDITETASRLAKMNMIILGDGHSNIKCLDSIGRPVRRKYHAVITNIPFNLKPSDIETAGKYDTGNTDTNELCVRHCMHALREGGKAAIVMPETIAYSGKYQALRNYIGQNAEIRAVIKLPDATFVSYTTARTFVLLLRDVWKSHTARFPVVTIISDGYSASKNREPVPENDIPALLELAGDLDRHYPQTDAAPDFKFYENTAGATNINDGDSWALAELLDVVTQKQKLEPNKKYHQPRLSGSTNTVSPSGPARLGMNINGDKVLTEKGDLIIATLHTQNGLFAYCDRPYFATSQIVAKVREDLVSKSYLAFALKKVLPALEKRDLVGRETYKREEILAVRIPKPTPALADAFRVAEQARAAAEKKLDDAIRREAKNFPFRE